MKTLRELVMEAASRDKSTQQGSGVADPAIASNEKAATDTHHADEIRAAIKAAKDENVDFVRCKFGGSKFINIGIAQLEKLAEMV